VNASLIRKYASDAMSFVSSVWIGACIAWTIALNAQTYGVFALDVLIVSASGATAAVRARTAPRFVAAAVNTATNAITCAKTAISASNAPMAYGVR